MTRRSLFALLLGLLAYVFFLLVKLPAAQVISRVDLPDNIGVQGISGTIWQGHIAQMSLQGIPLSNVRWQISPWRLLTGKLAMDIQAGNSRDVDALSLQGQLSLTPGAVGATDLQLYLPADLLIAKLPLPLPVNARGRFKVDLQELDYAQQCHSLSGKGQWLNAAVAGTQGYISLGNFNADLACENESVLVSINEPNQFGLTARATISPTLKIRVNGRFKPDQDLPQEVHDAARLFGQPDNQGYYQIRL
ncbi:type II secretion system protein N [Lacimicrobium sp. SS2-24]|uniref:type II secretion system protein N n=1 Tax=Lacimicrobium sp. SS2-24 TaxID=2005569 RepID=UPI000B4A8627|nr:type II secretion system protein N [Lacimicrobium sp. SS2-24]